MISSQLVTLLPPRFATVPSLRHENLRLSTDELSSLLLLQVKPGETKDLIIGVRCNKTLQTRSQRKRFGRTPPSRRPVSLHSKFQFVHLHTGYTPNKRVDGTSAALEYNRDWQLPKFDCEKYGGDKSDMIWVGRASPLPSECKCNMAVPSGVEGIVTYCDDRLARIWIEAVKREKQISFAYRSRHYSLGDWLLVSLTTDEVHKITPVLETRVLEIGVVQVRTQVIFGHCDEKIGHGTIIQSKYFKRVAVFTPFTGIILGRIYKVYVERIPQNQQWNEEVSGTYWFVSSNQIPELLPISKYPRNDIQLTVSLIGVVVSKAKRYTFVWTPTLGEGICENHDSLVIGRWIRFTINPYYRNFNHVNINFRVNNWTMADPVLDSISLKNSLMLISSVFVPYQPRNKLVADWVGPITDWDLVLRKVVHSFGVGQTYRIILKRVKKSPEEPITIWNVHKVLDHVNISRKTGIVCFVDIKKSSALAYAKGASLADGRMLQVDLKVFESVPALGDWFNFEINESSQIWKVVETEVILTDKISTKGHRIMLSVVLGAVADDANRLPNIVLDVSKKYTVWCTATQVAAPGDPCWRITNFCSLPVDFTKVAKLNTNAGRLNGTSCIAYIGIVVNECRTACFVWTPSLNEIICYCKDGLFIGDWIRFWIRKKQRSDPCDKLFLVSDWQKIDSLYRTRQEKNTAVVTVELAVSKHHSSRHPPSLPFFGKILDKKGCFGARINGIRGQVIEMDMKYIRTEKSLPSWGIVFVSVKDAQTAVKSIQHPINFLRADSSDFGEYPSHHFDRVNYEKNSVASSNEENKAHGDCDSAGDLQKVFI
uniref:Uncharacterized protein n=1 Tax=Setaria digitata TaxID=48799 RepID=A0A915PMP3_9BILA